MSTEIRKPVNTARPPSPHLGALAIVYTALPATISTITSCWP